MECDDRVYAPVFSSLRNDSVLVVKCWMEWFLYSMLVLYICLANREFKTKSIDAIFILFGYPVLLSPCNHCATEHSADSCFCLPRMLLSFARKSMERFIGNLSDACVGRVRTLH